MNYKNIVDPELVKIAKKIPFNKAIIRVANGYLKYEEKHIEIDAGVKHSQIIINGYNNLEMTVDIYEPETETQDSLPCLLHLHGGAFCYKASEYHRRLAMIYAKQANCRVIFPDYHLAPEYEYPASYLDALATYRYILNNAKKLKIDTTRIGITGDSAGGALAAMVCNSCEKEGLPLPKLQMLVYPVIGVKLDTESMRKFTDAPIWNSTNNNIMWDYYLDGKKADLSKLPMNSEISKNTPETYIETAEFDCLHDEGILYAKKIENAGISVILNETKKTFHGYDSALGATITKENITKRVDYLKKFFT